MICMVRGERMQLLIFENSPGIILKAQRYLSRQDTWYATMDDANARTLVARGDVDTIVVRRCHKQRLLRALGIETIEGMPGGRQIIVLPRLGCGVTLRKYLRSQQSRV